MTGTGYVFSPSHFYLNPFDIYTDGHQICMRFQQRKKAKIVFTSICRRQVELSPGVPWSAAVTMKVYSDRSAQLRGEAVFSSPVTGLRVKRSALAPIIR